MKDMLDPDIAALNMSEGEKNGLQVFRNYSQAFEKHRVQVFVDASNKEDVSLAELEAVCGLIVSEEVRSIPVIACAYSDDHLKAMYQREIPSDVPGGRGSLLSGLGPLSGLSQRIQIAYAFSWMSEDLLDELNHLRKIRNDISHKWDMDLLKNKMETLIRDTQYPLEESLGDGVRLPKNFHESLGTQQKFRIRMIWLVGRLTYETRLWVPALKAKLDSHRVLYGEVKPDLLERVAAICVEKTKKICTNESYQHTVPVPASAALPHQQGRG